MTLGDLGDQELADVARHGSRLGSALALVELAERRGVSLDEILPDPRGERT